MDNEIIWGGSGIEKVTFNWIREHVAEKATIIELGAGNVSTVALSQFYNLISIEHNKDWCGLVDGVEYIHAPIKGSWYDTKDLHDLPACSLVLIDGHTETRKGILNNLDLFNKDAIFLVHDTWRLTERELAYELALRLERKVTYFNKDDFFAVI